MFTDKEQEEIEALAKKNEVVKRLFEFWQSAQVDGIQAFYTSLNSQLLAISKQLDTKVLDISGEDKTFDRFLKLMVDGAKIGENMLTLRNGLSGEGKDTKKVRKGHEGKVVV